MNSSFLKLKRGSSLTDRIGTETVLSYMNPTREWALSLFATFIVLTLGVLWIGYDFYQQFGAPLDAVVINEQSVVYKAGEVVEYADLYEEREGTFNVLRKERVYVAPVSYVPDTNSGDEEVEIVVEGEPSLANE